jgi:molecular chaperone HtpG
MKTDFTTLAEQEAKKAESLPAFGGLNLLHIKRQVAVLLGLIGRGGIFDQYTRHDISHIDEMLASLEWLIPDMTKKSMSPADWLMVVLAIYFHDLGMLVTPGEFAARNTSDFPHFRDDVLFGGADGADYRAKVLGLGSDDAERFFYQEFVRHKHAERIRAWIMGQAKGHLGITHEAMNAVSKLLDPLGQQFRRDLGFVCESHHLNDLGDLKKYKPSQPYGNSDTETANLQYAAVLLRTADLLHVTSDRTPSIAFRVINPTDPISQQEWAKQMAVKRVRAKLGLNDEGLPDEKAPKDTVEIHAYFTKEDGFFGLTSYLSYAAEQLKKSNEWITTTAKNKLATHEFPWRRIDDTNIETAGFIRDTFEFTLDQARILDLLTGHTLYNDTGVVLRELVQNAIDAVRLQHYPTPPGNAGKVSITWDSRKRILSVADNGTGMTQKIITSFLLKVGTSRYQDPEFRKQYPQFSSISRFGIGVLSTFMIADSVEILTCHAEEDLARQLTLRSVHGKYLIRLLDKSDKTLPSIAPHGTVFRLKVRPSVRMQNVKETAEQWVVVPECEVTVTIDDGKPERIGFDSPSLALAGLLNAKGIATKIAGDPNATPTENEKKEIRIVDCEADGISLAYALQWNEYFREWGFVPGDRLRDSEAARVLLGTCIEGIRIEFDSPGFRGTPVLALANVKGLNAPKTNVARSGIEVTPERDAMLRTIYQMYVNHIAREINELHMKRSFSLTWATGESRFLLEPLISSQNQNIRPLNETLFDESLQNVPALLVEKGNQRTTIPAKALSKEKEFWTIECGLFQSAEPLIKEAATSASLAQLIRALNLPGFDFPSGIVLCGTNTRDSLGRFAFRDREVAKIRIHTDQRRVDLAWVDKLTPSRWLTISEDGAKILSHIDDEDRLYSLGRFSRQRAAGLVLGLHSIDIQPKVVEIGVRAAGQLFLFPESGVAKFLRPYFELEVSRQSIDNTWAVVFLCLLVKNCTRLEQINNAQELVRRLIRSIGDKQPHSRGSKRIEDLFEESKLVEFIENNQWRVFDPGAWQRGPWMGLGNYW